MSENETNAPTISDTQRAALAIGQKLATTNRHSVYDRGRKPMLKLGSSWGNQWVVTQADLPGAVGIARHVLFGADTAHKVRTNGVVLSPSYNHDLEASGAISNEDKGLSPVRLDGYDNQVRHPFWDSFEPSTRPLDDWQLLAGHMQRIHLELMSRLVAGQDPRPPLMKIAAMGSAVTAVQRAAALPHERPYHLQRSHHYLVMQNWSANRAEAVKQIRAFLTEHAAVRCSVKQETKEPDIYLVKPAGANMIKVAHQDYLAVNEDTGEITVFDHDEISRMHH
ncbi:MAG: hypothetical protein L0H31_12630 [Nocardioidaceae bacterium]|nr:hypothetical protein [Nocardioidaceae bacterium]